MKRKNHVTEASLYPGTIVMIDLDEFEELTERLGLDEYKPNFATGTLTNLVEEIAVKRRGVVIHGLDPIRGTEEAVIEFPDTRPDEIIPDLKRVLNTLRNMGVKATIVVVEGMVSGRPARTQSEAFKGTPWRSMAYRLLLKAKRRGGDTIIVA